MTSGASAITALIALIAVVIAAGQWHTVRTKLVLDLFEQRLAVADSLLSTVGAVLSNGVVTPNDILTFAGLQSRAAYLFGRDVVSYLETIRSDLAKLGRARANRFLEFHEQQSKPMEDADAAFARVASFPVAFGRLTNPYMCFDAKLPPWRRGPRK